MRHKQLDHRAALPTIQPGRRTQRTPAPRRLDIDVGAHFQEPLRDVVRAGRLDGEVEGRFAVGVERVDGHDDGGGGGEGESGQRGGQAGRGGRERGRGRRQRTTTTVMMVRRRG